MIFGCVSVARLFDSVRDNRGTTKDGPGTVGSGVLPGLTPDKEGLMAETMPPACDAPGQAR